MVQFGTIEMDLSGDVGGAGINRMHWQRTDAAAINVADCNSAAAAWHGVWQGVHANMPFGYTVTTNPAVEIREVDTGAPDDVQQLTAIPAVVTGSDTGHYAAGVGVRVNWKSSSVRNRRFMRGATLLVPLVSDTFTTGGVVDATFISGLVTTLNTFLAAMASNTLEMIVWHRPAKGQTTGGAAGLVTGFSISTVPASLRSRRT
jgi:hypothetical protein